ncbi:unnamed protein product [Moneuplotes crassus]|uniref:Transcription elongation factor 1 homolog n=1 Tax=Euplotes crassus TaxID=5936 RepID=A0AAD1Y458_EUPCR|nr:unnamed protein product [Moneuplotes crassus]
MGGRKKQQAPKAAKKYTIPTVFDCPFCNQHESVEVKIETEAAVGNVFCRLCSASFQTSVHHLMEPIDIYCEWIDQSEKLQKEMDSKDKKTLKAATGDFQDDFDNEAEGEGDYADEQEEPAPMMKKTIENPEEAAPAKDDDAEGEESDDYE